MDNNTITIGTRGSQLALYQAYRVRDAIINRHPHLNAEIKIIKTKGDKILDIALSKIGDKGLFTKELEVELTNGTIDLAVHSLKDLPTRFPEGLTLGGVLERGEFRDALVHKTGKKFDELDATDVIATSSLRRRAQLLRQNPDLKIVDIRGNVNTRLQKMQDGHCTAMIMAAAGLQRLELGHLITETLDPETFIPAVSQGAIAMESRDNDLKVLDILESITHQPTMLAVSAERTFLRMLEGGCQVPIGCFTQVTPEGFRIKGFISNLEATEVIQDERSGSPEQTIDLAKELATFFISKGSVRILDEIRRQNK
ncbi:MAG: hydroxymethylbilane synthase [Bacteroidetes bacterium]|nr:MAG: hydroxymethylbilane synthase [Bacteroidota bacterium]